MIRNIGSTPRRLAAGAFSVVIEPGHTAYVPNIAQVLAEAKADPSLIVVAQSGLAYPAVGRAVHAVKVADLAESKRRKRKPSKIIVM